MKWSEVIISAAVILSTGVLASGPQVAAAQIFSATCQLTVDGNIFLNGHCPVYIESDGSFTLNVARPHRPVTWFAYVSVSPTGATASWNGEKGVDKADVSLGTVTRDGPCWVNDRVRLCARR